MRSTLSRLQGHVQYRHVYRKANQLADWLANIAKETTQTTDLTTHLR